MRITKGIAAALATFGILGVLQQAPLVAPQSPAPKRRKRGRIYFKPRGTTKAHDMEQYRRRYSHCLSGMGR